MNLSFIIIGAQKAATTFVQRGLVDHPQVSIPDLESDVLIYNREAASVTRIIDRLFDGVPERPVKGLKSADYLGHPEMAADVARIYPGVKIIAILREPVDRAFSAYHHLIRYGFFPALSPQDGLAKVFSGEWDDPYPASHQVRTFGEYGKHLEKWIDVMGADRVLVLRQEDLLRNKNEGMRRIYRFLGVDENFVSQNLDKRSQAVTYHLGRLRWLSLGGKVRRLLEKRRADGTINAGALEFMVKLSWLGITAVDRVALRPLLGNAKSALSPELISNISEYYREDQAILKGLVNNQPEAFCSLGSSDVV